MLVPGLPGPINLKLNFSSSVPPTDPRISNPALPHLNSAFRRGGYSEKTSEELTRALGVLALHGALQLAAQAEYREGGGVVGGAAPGAPASSQGPYGPSGLVAAAPGADRPVQGAGAMGAVASTFPRASSPPALPGLPLGPSLPLPVNNNSFGLATAGKGSHPEKIPHTGDKASVDRCGW